VRFAPPAQRPAAHLLGVALRDRRPAALGYQVHVVPPYPRIGPHIRHRRRDRGEQLGLDGHGLGVRARGEAARPHRREGQQLHRAQPALLGVLRSRRLEVQKYR
jgi:hypothetical protein